MTFDTRVGKGLRVESADADPGRFGAPGQPVSMQQPPEPPVTPSKPKLLLLSLAVTVALAACDRDDAREGDTAAPAADAKTALTLDESTLPPVNRLAADQIDTS